MDAKPKQEPRPEKRRREVIRIVRGNERNMWAKPRGQRPDRLHPPTYEAT
jgi:hypothetical protein